MYIKYTQQLYPTEDVSDQFIIYILKIDVNFKLSDFTLSKNYNDFNLFCDLQRKIC